MVIDTLIRETAKQLSDNAQYEAREIVMRALSLSRTDVITNPNREVGDEEVRAVTEMARRRQNGEPLQYILGECEFMSLPFYADEGVLIPRSDTETLVEAVMDRAFENILDICTGSGCVGISLAHYISGASVTMVDISEKAVQAAKKNAARNNVTRRVNVMRLDILSDIPDGEYDLIVSNPPYIETAVIDTLDSVVKDYEPHLALDGGADGLTFYRRITDIAPRLLRRGGVLAFEIGYNQGEAVSSLMQKSFSNIEIIKDLAGCDRVVRGELKWKTK